MDEIKVASASDEEPRSEPVSDDDLSVGSEHKLNTEDGDLDVTNDVDIIVEDEVITETEIPPKRGESGS